MYLKLLLFFIFAPAIAVKAELPVQGVWEQLELVAHPKNEKGVIITRSLYDFETGSGLRISSIAIIDKGENAQKFIETYNGTQKSQIVMAFRSNAQGQFDLDTQTGKWNEVELANDSAFGFAPEDWLYYNESPIVTKWKEYYAEQEKAMHLNNRLDAATKYAQLLENVTLVPEKRQYVIRERIVNSPPVLHEFDVDDKNMVSTYRCINPDGKLTRKVENRLISKYDFSLKSDEFGKKFDGPRIPSKLAELGVVGLALAKQDDKTLVQSVLTNSPAQKAGIKRSAEVLAINGTDVAELSLQDCYRLMKEEPQVELKFREDGSSEVQKISIKKVFNIWPR